MSCMSCICGGSHHCDQISQISEDSVVTLCRSKAKVPSVTEWVIDKVTYWTVLDKSWKIKKKKKEMFSSFRYWSVFVQTTFTFSNSILPFSWKPDHISENISFSQEYFFPGIFFPGIFFPGKLSPRNIFPQEYCQFSSSPLLISRYTSPSPRWQNTPR